jgi:hypothetical protein
MRLVWALILIVPVVVILGVETYALVTEGLTLSRFIWNIGERWPLFIYLLGFVNGILAAHFFWPWDPRNSKSGA